MDDRRVMGSSPLPMRRILVLAQLLPFVLCAQEPLVDVMSDHGYFGAVRYANAQDSADFALFRRSLTTDPISSLLKMTLRAVPGSADGSARSRLRQWGARRQRLRAFDACLRHWSKQRSAGLPHLHRVTTTIPLHELPERTTARIRVEHIAPVEGPVVNGVHRHSYDELFFFLKGEGVHMIDLEQHAVVAPCMHLVAAGQVHQLSRSADMQAVVVLFGQDALMGRSSALRAELFARAGRPCAVVVEAKRAGEALELVGLMERELDGHEAGAVEVVEGYLGILLLKCAQWVRESAEARTHPGDEHDPVRRFQELVEQGYLEQRQVGHYADKLALSADHLNELVKKRLGRTASAVIHERLLLEAKRLLLHGDQSIKEVGYALNLKDPAYFTRWFRKAEGSTPAAYRDRIREKYQR